MFSKTFKKAVLKGHAFKEKKYRHQSKLRRTIFGAKVAGFVSSLYESGADGAMFDWAGIFQVTGIITFAVTVLFVLLFHDKQKYELDNQAGQER